MPTTNNTKEGTISVHSRQPTHVQQKRQTHGSTRIVRRSILRPHYGEM